MEQNYTDTYTGWKMLTKYKIVKIRFSSLNKDYYAYERTRFWVFKSYLNIDSSCDIWYDEIKLDRPWCFVDTLEEAKKIVKSLEKPKQPEVTITDAETKLERHLGGLE